MLVFETGSCKMLSGPGPGQGPFMLFSCSSPPPLVLLYLATQPWLVSAPQVPSLAQMPKALLGLTVLSAWLLLAASGSYNEVGSLDRADEISSSLHDLPGAVAGTHKLMRIDQ